MKTIHYDAEGDILTVVFAETDGHRHTGVELSDNIVLYFDPDSEQPLELFLSSYQAMLLAHAQKMIPLDGLETIPAALRATILRLLHRAPLSSFLQLVDLPTPALPASRLREVFMPTILQTVAAS